MRICHITTVHSVKDARIFYRMCSALAARNLSVTMVGTSAFVENSGVRGSPWNERIARAGRFHRIGLALRAALAEKAEIYHFHDPELILMGLALKTLRPSSAVVYDVHEDYPSMMREKYWLPKFIRPLVAGSAHIANSLAGILLDGIVTADPGVQQDFQKIARDKTIVYYNFPDLSVFRPSANGSEVVADLIYIGGMSDRSGIFVLLDALSLLAGQGIRPSVRLAGYTDGEKGRLAIEDGIRTRGLQDQIDLRGRILHSEVPNWIRTGRIGLVMLQPIPKFMKNIPSKLFEYWACGLPVIASDLPPTRRFLGAHKNGLPFSPTSSKSLAGAIRYMLEHPKERQEMGRFAQRQVFEDWNNGRQIDTLIRFYNGILR